MESKAAVDNAKRTCFCPGVGAEFWRFLSCTLTNAPVPTSLALKGGSFLTQSDITDKLASLQGQQKGAQGTWEMSEQKGTHTGGCKRTEHSWFRGTKGL